MTVLRGPVDKSAVVSVSGRRGLSTAEQSCEGVEANAANDNCGLTVGQPTKGTVASTGEQNDGLSLQQMSIGDQVE